MGALWSEQSSWCIYLFVVHSMTTKGIKQLIFLKLSINQVLLFVIFLKYLEFQKKCKIFKHFIKEVIKKYTKFLLNIVQNLITQLNAIFKYLCRL